MFNRAPSLGRLTLALLCLAGLIGLFFMVRCRPGTTALIRSAADSKQLAHVTVLNVSNCSWQVSFALMVGGERRILKLPLDKSIEVKLTAGEYEVEQTMVVAEAGPDATRRFSMKLDSGEHYRWRLVTLLSDSMEAKAQP